MVTFSAPQPVGSVGMWAVSQQIDIEEDWIQISGWCFQIWMCCLSHMRNIHIQTLLFMGLNWQIAYFKLTNQNGSCSIVIIIHYKDILKSITYILLWPWACNHDLYSSIKYTLSSQTTIYTVWFIHLHKRSMQEWVLFKEPYMTLYLKFDRSYVSKSWIGDVYNICL